MPARTVWVLDGEPIDLAASAAKLQELLDAAAGDADLPVTIHLALEVRTDSPIWSGMPDELLPVPPGIWRQRIDEILRTKRWVVPPADETP